MDRFGNELAAYGEMLAMQKESKQSQYEYFSSRDELLKAALEVAIDIQKIRRQHYYLTGNKEGFKKASAQIRDFRKALEELK